MFSGVRESGWQGACCIFCRLHDHQTKNDKGLYRLCRTERPLPRRQKKEVTQEMEPAATARVLNIAPRAGVSACRVTGRFPAREMHSMFALGANYPCKARDRVFVSGAGLATNAYSCDRALFWRTICFLTVSSPTNCSKSFQEKIDYYPLKVSL